ncbi:S-layer homology domain-containing protein [Algivirga pacifica]|uniref:SLH domain-containing protein n=1 Tax=Algivirga pacifica TaxID=1162670 RepID=A0ABP9DI68_9BACT
MLRSSIQLVLIFLLGALFIGCESTLESESLEQPAPVQQVEETRYKGAEYSANARTADVASHWAEQEINYMMDNGYISGYPDGSFRPDNTITRAEYASMIVAVLNPEENPTYANRDFSDIGGHWAEAKILQVARAGYMSGYPDGTFAPNATISRTEVFAALNAGLGIGTADESILDQYTDASSIASWARPSIAKATEAGLVYNYPTISRLWPNEAAYRCEAVTALFQMLVREGVASPIANDYQVKIETSVGGHPEYADFANDNHAMLLDEAWGQITAGTPCAAFVSATLRRFDYDIWATVTDGTPYENSLGYCLKYELQRYGYQQSFDISKVRKGDICFTIDKWFPDSDGGGYYPTHVYFFMEWVTPGQTDYAWIVDNQGKRHIRNMTVDGDYDKVQYFMYID